MLLKNLILLLSFFIFLTSNTFSQYYTKAQLTAINSSKGAFEGDMYLDTINNNYYIGTTNGKLAYIGHIDSITYSNDTLKFYQGDSIFSIQIVDDNGPWRNTDGTAATDTSTKINFPNGNVGIGVINPKTKLQVKSGYITSGESTSSTTGGLIIAGDYANGSLSNFGSAYSSGAPMISYGTKQLGSSSWLSTTGISLKRSAIIAHSNISFFTAPSEINAIGNALTTQPSEVMTILNNGYVGIGTTGPDAGLSILTSANTGRTLKAVQQNASISNNVYTFEVNSSAHTSNLTSAGAMAINVNAGRAFTIDGFGKTGIGINQPKGNLHVHPVGSNFGYTSLIIGGDNSGANTELAEIGFRRSNYNATENAAAIVFYRTTTGLEGGMRFKTQNNASSLDTVLDITPNGRVGIGTSVPQSKLDLKGDFGHSGVLISRGNTYSFTWMRFAEHQWGNSTIIGAGGLTVLGSGEFATIGMSNFSTGTETLVLGSDNDIRFITGTQIGGWGGRVDAMHITNTGNVGIGNLSPTIKLDVSGKSQNQNARSTASSSTTESTTSTTFVDVPGLSVTVTTANADILILADIPAIHNSGTDASVNFRIVVDGVQKGAIVEHENSNTGIIWNSSLHALSNVTAGAHTIKVQWSVQGGTGYINSSQSVLKGPRTLSVVEL